MKYLGGTSNEGYHNVKTDFRSYFISFGGEARLEIMNKPHMADDLKDQRMEEENTKAALKLTDQITAPFMLQW